MAFVYLVEMIKPPPIITSSRLNGSHPIMAVKTTLASRSDELKKEKKLLQLFHDSPYIVRCFGDDITITTDNNGNKTKLYNVFLEYAQGGCLGDFMGVTILCETKEEDGDEDFVAKISVLDFEKDVDDWRTLVL
uniref:Protein kinase domain-containing protein n=1 Tax=Cannabis sativa TaxID=3483 RepID=A0A803NGI7_CANSA